MADNSRTTQEVVLAVAASAATAATTQELVLALQTGGVARTTHEVVLALSAGGVARTTQELALAVAAPTGRIRTTQNLVLVLAPPPAPSRTTQESVLTVSESEAEARTTQELILVLREPPAPARTTQEATLAVATSPAAAQTTQELVLVLGTHSTQTARTTQNLVLAIESLNDLAARTTQQVVLIVGNKHCDADSDGCGRYTFERLKDRTLRMLGEDPDHPVYWTDAEIGRLVNDAYTELAIQSRAYETEQSTTTTIDEAEYELDAGNFAVRRVSYDGAFLRNVTKLEMDLGRGAWGEQGEVWGYVTTQQPPLSIRLVEVPDEEAELVVWATGVPEALEDRCDAPELPAWTHQAIVFGAASRALRKPGEMRSLELSAVYRGIYEDYLGMLKAVAGA